VIIRREPDDRDGDRVPGTPAIEQAERSLINVALQRALFFELR